MLTARWATKWAMLVGAAVGCAGVGCSSADSSNAPSTDDPCLGTQSSALKTCAGGTVLHGIDVSYYQANVDWKKVKASGKDFAFARVSDGTAYPDTKFATNWPAMKSAGIVRGVYQFFRPGQDVTAQVNLLVSKVNAAGGLKEGDLPPVLDLESDGGLAASTVVARAKDWLDQVEKKFGIKPIVYTAAFMSNVIGNNFGGYTLWVANYGATCPTMPSGWTDWHFWQNADNGQVSGITTGGVDTNVFNGNMAELLGLTLKGGAPAPTTTGPVELDVDENQAFGDQGATLGSGTPSSAKEPQSAPFTPCR